MLMILVCIMVLVVLNLHWLVLRVIHLVRLLLYWQSDSNWWIDQSFSTKSSIMAYVLMLRLKTKSINLIKILFAETLNLFLFNLLFINNNTAKGTSSICLEKTFKFCETSLMDNMFWMTT
jgi:hypothetical protein